MILDAAISAPRSAACAASLAAASPPISAGTASGKAATLACSASPAGSMTRVPSIKFIPLAEPYLPGSRGSSRTVVCWKAGRAALTPRLANTTREEQSPLGLRFATAASSCRAWSG